MNEQCQALPEELENRKRPCDRCGHLLGKKELMHLTLWIEMFQGEWQEMRRDDYVCLLCATKNLHL